MPIYTRPMLLATLLGLLVSGAAVAAPPHQNTLDLVERLLTADQELPPEVFEGAGPQAVGRPFLFDDLLDEQPEALLGGVQYVISNHTPPEDAALRATYTREMDARLQALFEYYPLVARTPEDFERLLALIEDGRQAPVLRSFLIRRCAPGLAARSAFSAYVDGMLADRERLEIALLRIVENPTESTEVQDVAAPALGASIAASYANLLATDPMVRDQVGRGNAEPHIRDLKASPEAVPLTRRTRLRIERKNEAVARAGVQLAAVARDPNRSLALRRAVEAIVAEIARTYPVPNAADLIIETRQQPPPQ